MLKILSRIFANCATTALVRRMNMEGTKRAFSQLLWTCLLMMLTSFATSCWRPSSRTTRNWDDAMSMVSVT